jgi:pyruvate-ferredoxin/flavodoxin oxidoreductase
MATKKFITIDGNEAVAYVAYRCNEVIAIYPITPSSNMGEWCDQWASEEIPNLWGSIPSVTEMQSEAGAAGAVHGALQSGALTCTFTASQGLFLKIPNMYKIAGELTPTVFHITARTVSSHALSIFGDHSDVMSARATGFALFSSASVQEAMDFALIAQAATLEARVPFLHYFDGFRTSHEVSKIEMVTEDIIRAMINEEHVVAFRQRAMNPDQPVLRGTAQNPDVFFQAREACNPFYDRCAAITQKAMDQFAGLTGRVYKIYQYEGAPDAERVIVLMGSGGETAHETVAFLNQDGAKTGIVKVRLYRPFDMRAFMEALPATVKSIAVLDRTKEPGSAGEPLYLDVVATLHEGLANGWGTLRTMPKVLAGRYGLASKEFTPAMVKAVFDNLAAATPKNHFTVGINDDVTGASLVYDPEFSTEPSNVVRAMFYGLGSDGTVGANKNSIKIIGENTPNYAQGYFVYDSKKAGAVTVSHLRFGPNAIRSTYLVSKANFVACHQPVFLERYDMLEPLIQGGTFLLNTANSKDEVWNKLPKLFQERLIQKKAKFYVIDAVKVARETGMGGRINTIMQTCFFALSGVLPREEAIEQIKYTIKKTYGKKGEEIVRKNIAAVDQTLANLIEVPVTATVTSQVEMPPVFATAPDNIRKSLGVIYGNLGETLPVSAFLADGTFPTATAQYEKRNLAIDIPVWDEKTCIQCGKCVVICPHATIRMKIYDAKSLEGAPATFKSCDARSPEFKGLKFSLQVAPEDCTGCVLCVEVCPAKNKSAANLKAINMQPQAPLRAAERENWDFFLKLPEFDRRKIKVGQLRQQQIMQPLFEFSGACAGCGETPYLKLLTQLFGDRMVVGNATGCSSIYGGNLPTTPWTVDNHGRGPTWNNSLFEDNAEFVLGFRLSIDKQKQFACELVQKLAPQLGDDLVGGLVTGSEARDEAGIHDQRERVAVLRQKLQGNTSSEARMLLGVAGSLVRRSVWAVGGDGWAYDIGYGGLDHVLASGKDVNLIVLDTEVYSNTGGQMSKSTPRGAVAKFAAGGKPLGKKDLGLIAMSYGNVYVASLAMGAKDEHTLKALTEAESYPGVSLVICYSHCIAHGIEIDRGLGAKQQKLAVETGQWLLYRYDPRRTEVGENPLQLDSAAAKLKVQDYLLSENRFKMLTKSKPEDAKRYFELAQHDADARWQLYSYLAARKLPGATAAPAPKV